MYISFAYFLLHANFFYIFIQIRLQIFLDNQLNCRPLCAQNWAQGMPTSLFVFVHCAGVKMPKIAKREEAAAVAAAAASASAACSSAIAAAVAAAAAKV